MDRFGVYVHVPFCTRRCDYCDFATWTDRHHLMEAYAAACVTDLIRRYDSGPVPPASSVFFGGGTPSLLPAELLVGILAAVPRRPDAEVTVECNPDTVTPELLAAYRAGGVTRLSLGVQSMAPHVLAALGRTHDPAGVERAVAAAREAGFDNFNLDLIYGGAGETPADWRATLEAALALDPPHVSAYALTVEAGTPLARRIGAGEVTGPDDDDQAEKYLAADAALTAAGRPWYEISNWARPGLGMPPQPPLLGPGRVPRASAAPPTATPRPGGAGGTSAPPTATSTSSPRVLRRKRGTRSCAGPERADEAAMLALRTREGVPAGEAADRLLADGLAERRGARVVLTPAGRLLANEATTRLLGAPTCC